MIKNSLDNPDLNDNRNYDYSMQPKSIRTEYRYLINLIEPYSKIIDLGCGNGSLMELMILEKKADIRGLEISESGVQICLSKGLNVKKGRIDEQMIFDDNEFDYSICNATIQMVMSPEVLLKEMKRISKFQIISFPNFAFYKNRLDLLFNGRMPKPMLFGYKWYNTGHLHQMSIKDFYVLINDVGGLKIKKIILQNSVNPIKNFLMKNFQNLFQVLPIFELEKINQSYKIT